MSYLAHGGILVSLSIQYYRSQLPQARLLSLISSGARVDVDCGRYVAQLLLLLSFVSSTSSSLAALHSSALVGSKKIRLLRGR